MPVTLGIKASADANNQISFGTDSGIYVPTPARHSGAFMSTIDNNWGSDSTTWYYAQPNATSVGNNTGTGSGTAGTAQLWPLMVTRTCRVTDVYVRVTTASAASTFYLTLYAADATLGTAGAKIADIGSVSMATAGNARILPGATVTLQGGTLYWVAAVQRGGTLAQTSVRCSNFGSIRLTATPSYSYFSGFSAFGYTDSTFTSGSPATATVTAPDPASAFGAYIYLPYLWWGLSNQ